MEGQPLDDLQTWRVIAFLRSVQRREVDQGPPQAARTGLSVPIVSVSRLSDARDDAANWLTIPEPTTVGATAS